MAGSLANNIKEESMAIDITNTPHTFMRPCETCGGTGEIDSRLCPECKWRKMFPTEVGDELLEFLNFVKPWEPYVDAEVKGFHDQIESLGRTQVKSDEAKLRLRIRQVVREINSNLGWALTLSEWNDTDEQAKWKTLGQIDAWRSVKGVLTAALEYPDEDWENYLDVPESEHVD